MLISSVIERAPRILSLGDVARLEIVMRDEHNNEDLIELGAATDLTRGIYAPNKREQLVREDYKD